MIRSALLKALTLAPLFAAALLVSAAPAQDAGQESPLAVHMSRMLAGGGQWRTPNPDHDPADPSSVSHFGANFRLSDDQSHVIAEITGITPDGRVARYWSIYLFHNPVTSEVISVQTGWSGAYMEGRAVLRRQPLALGEPEIADALVFEPTGGAHMLRHEIVFPDERTHTTQTYERDESGSWKPRNFRVWTLEGEE